jgi:hypothetical protein
VKLHRTHQIPRPLPHHHTARISHKNTRPAFSLRPHHPHPHNKHLGNRKSIHSSQHIQIKSTPSLSHTRYKSQMRPTRSQLTLPEAMDVTPLLNPTTETGVNRFVVVPSPSCSEKHNVVSNKRLLDKNRQTLKSPKEQKQEELYLAIRIVTPAFHAPFARDNTRVQVILHHTRQIPRPPSQQNMALSSPHARAARTSSSVDNQTQFETKSSTAAFTFRHMKTTG